VHLTNLSSWKFRTPLRVTTAELSWCRCWLRIKRSPFKLNHKISNQGSKFFLENFRKNFAFFMGFSHFFRIFLKRIRFAFASHFFFEKIFAFASLSHSTLCQNLNPWSNRIHSLSKISIYWKKKAKMNNENDFILGSFLSIDHVNKLPISKKSSTRRLLTLKRIKKIFMKKSGPPKVGIKRFRRRSSVMSIEFWEEWHFYFCIIY